jgi:hypothetical protein
MMNVEGFEWTGDDAGDQRNDISSALSRALYLTALRRFSSPVFLRSNM